VVLPYNDATTVSCHVYSRQLVLVIACTLLWGSQASWAAEHPGLVDKDCTACHTEKITGRSVHSAMNSPCSVCHVKATQGDMTTLSLSMPKSQICSACHEERAALRQHAPAVKGPCLECHDAHSSRYRLLLLRDGLPFRTAATKRK
jgi:predicted CXXCH cytochrome family protein